MACRTLLLWTILQMVVTAEGKPRSYALAGLPWSFEPNHGQADVDVRFLARGTRGSIFFRDGSVDWTVLDTSRQASLYPRGAAREVMVDGVAPQPGVSHYFYEGRQPIQRVPHFERVRYQGWFPGIDLMFYGSDRQLEFDAVVQPGADPASISFGLRGADRLTPNRDGSLTIVAGSMVTRLGKPVAYQMTGRGRIGVSCRFRAEKSGFGFIVGAYDRSKPLVIDPTLSTTYLGGRDSDLATAVAIDPGGNIYVTGYTASTNFPLSAVPYRSNLTAGDADAFVMKLNPTGTSILYSTYLGGAFADYARAIAVDASGAAYITGSTIGRFPTTSGAFREMPANAPAIFVAKLDPSGGALVYSTYLDGAGAGQGIAVDASGNAFVVGSTYTATFTTTAGAYQRAYAGGTDAFVVKLNPAGSGQLYSTFLGGSGEDQAMAVRVDNAGMAYVAGFTNSADFPVSAGAYRTAYSGATDAFVAKVGADGATLGYATYLGASSVDRAYALDVNGNGEAYVVGQTYSSSFPTTAGAYRTTLGGGSDAFVVRLNAAGTNALFATFLGGSGACMVADPFRQYQCDSAFGVAVDATGVWVAGLAGSGFPLVGAIQPAPGGNGDAFLAELSLSGGSLLFSSYMGGGAGDVALGLANDIANGPVIVGFTRSADLPFSAGGLQSAPAGGAQEGFLARGAPCTATLGSAGSFFPNSAGSYSLSVFASNACSWSATSDVGWVTQSNSSGLGNGTISYTVAANTGAFRVGHITVSGQVFTIQQVTGLCVIPAVSSAWHPQAGGSYSLPIFATCGWSATSNAAWVTVTSGSGSGNGQVNYTVAANNTGTSRSGTIDISGQIYTVNQVGGPGSLSCSYILSSTAESFTSDGGSSSLLLLTETGCEWTVVNPNPWITLTAGAAGNGDGIIGYTVGRNGTGQTRTGVFVIAGQSFVVTQSGL